MTSRIIFKYYKYYLIVVHLGVGGQVVDGPPGAYTHQGGVGGVHPGAHQAGGLGRLPEGLAHQSGQV